jgi:hypothetical protein
VAVEVDGDQHLAFAIWRLAKFGRLVAEGVVVPDDPTLEAEAAAQAWAAQPSSARLSRGASRRQLHRLSEWREKVLRPQVMGVGDAVAGRLTQAWLVAWEPLWDLSRLGRDFAPGRGKRNYGGWSFDLFEGGKPRLFLRQVSEDMAISRWTGEPWGAPRPGPVIGLCQLVRALAGKGLGTLAAACRELEVAPPAEDGDFLDRLADRVRAVEELALACFAECDFWERRRGDDREGEDAHPTGVLADPRWLYSSGGLFRSFRETAGGLPLGERIVEGELGHDRVVGAFAAATHGGRSEAYVVREPELAQHWDFSGTYGHVARLSGLSRFYFAHRMVADECTAKAISELSRLQDAADPVALLLDPTWWHRWCFTVVRCSRPDVGALLPVRVPSKARPGDWTMRFAPVTTDEDQSLWVMMTDLASMVLLDPDGPGVEVHEAFGVRAEGKLRGLRPVELPGEVCFDPGRHGADLFTSLLTSRDASRDFPCWTPAQRSRRQAAVKGLLVSGSSGVTARVDRNPLPKRPDKRKEGHKRLEVIGPDGERIRAPAGARFEEKAAPDNFPPAAASVLAGGRLLLALTERMVRDQGDLGVEWGDGTGRATSTARVLQVVVDALTVSAVTDMSAVAKRLYEGLGVVLRPQYGSDREPLVAWVGGRSRYVLVRGAEVVTRREGAIGSRNSSVRGGEVAHASEIFLGGVYLDPSGRDDAPGPSGMRAWTEEAVRAVAGTYTGDDPELPGWAGNWAVSPFRGAAPEQLAWLGEGARPFDQGLALHVATGPGGGAPAPVVRALWSTSPEDWPGLTWRGRDGSEVEAGDSEAVFGLRVPGLFVPRTVADAIGKWAASAEPGKHPVFHRMSAGAFHQGELEPIAYRVTGTVLVGKEGVDLAERPRGTSPLGQGELVVAYAGSEDVDLPLLARTVRAMTPAERRKVGFLDDHVGRRAMSAIMHRSWAARLRQEAQRAEQTGLLGDDFERPLLERFAEHLETCRGDGCSKPRDCRSLLCQDCRQERNRRAVARHRANREEEG